VAVIDEVLARRFVDGQSPLGRRVRLSSDRTWREVIGVVGGVHQMALERDREPHFYVAQAQMPSPALTLVIRGPLEPHALTKDVRAAIALVDPEQPVSNVRTLEDLVAGSIAPRRFSTLLLTLFAAIAISLTAVGIYGVVSQSLAQATREIGVRVALGASAGAVVSRILSLSTRLALVGVMAGGLAAWIAGPSLAGLLYGVQPHDPIALAAGAALIASIATAAAYFPARRALRIDVVNALRRLADDRVLGETIAAITPR
jgi:putative ABC transport system permease protein